MRRLDRVGRFLVWLGLLSLLMFWLFLSGMLVVGRGDVEAYLLEHFGHNRPADAFDRLNRVLPGFAVFHSILLMLAMIAIRFDRLDVFSILLIGPALAMLITLITERWSDPNWFNIAGVCSIGWLVSIAVGIAYWRLKPKRGLH